MILFVNADGFFFSEALSDQDGEEERMEIYFQGNQVRNKGAYLVNSGIYIPFSMVGKYINNPGITVDEENKQMLMELSKVSLMLEDLEVTDFIKQNMEQATIPLKNIKDEFYLPLDVLQSFFHVTYNIKGNRVYIEKAEDVETVGRINKESLKVKPSVSDARSEDLILGSNDILRIISETENYYKVRTKDGISCFVKKKDMDLFNMDLSQVDFYNFPRRKVDYSNEKINLVWEYVNLNTPLPDEEKNKAIDIISPTWFYIKDSEGNLGNKADKGYLNQIHKLGYKVWGLVTNSFDANLTHTVLNDEKLSKKVAAQLVFYASLYNLDGLNIDFESVKDEDRDALTNFVSMMRYYTQKQGLTLSIDILIPAPWTIEYDKGALSRLVDYIAVMTYDEHWSTCTIAGSVASYGWVEKAVVNSLKDIPSEKLLIGIPLYTRLWTENVVNGATTVSSKSLSMAQVREIVKDKETQVTWLDKEKQYYVQYNEDGKTYKIWIEDPRSIAYKLGLVEKYDLGGSASWRKGFEDEEVWEIFEDIIKKEKSASRYKELEY